MVTFLTILMLCFNIFMMGYAGILASRVNTYSFGGRLWMPFFIAYWILFYFIGGFLLMLALPLRLLGFKIFPIFIPDMI
ncbi:hypothetical protein [Acidithiobacillus sp.]|uniref:hypothetical protein n=1 Tax=Acidithiobacillus sp. TaxID=1872118 RepID=UPI003D02FE3E